ncbi:hypothetical protein QNJ95_24385 [Bradyrhizobium elkanii]|uniref:hypothetical protein n=1 Tax=Bradyrhizobium elkanii TaxID=29448 RepID=UPI002711E1C8|nr:hypothetical protein [Bradyrhizobium elkanii]WLA36183.1 hypothetical protein QNJ95_24385 [Bradyrhizobium elkanii]
MKNEKLETPPPGWFALDVMKTGDGRKWDWVALMVDTHPDELKHCLCHCAKLYVHPDDYQPVAGRVAREAFVRVPGKHRNADAAWDAIQSIISPGH